MRRRAHETTVDGGHETVFATAQVGERIAVHVADDERFGGRRLQAGFEVRERRIGEVELVQQMFGATGVGEFD